MILKCQNINSVEQLTYPSGQDDHDSLLYIFNQLDLKDCFTCRLVCRSWSTAINQHFRTLPKLYLSYVDSSNASTSQQQRTSLNAEDHHELLQPQSNKSWEGDQEPQSGQKHKLVIQQILSYQRFAHLLALFPSVCEFSLLYHPVNDVFLSLLVVFLPRLQHLRLQSCWMHPSMLVERLHRSENANSPNFINPTWSYLSRLTCPKYLQPTNIQQKEKDDASLEYLLDALSKLQKSDHLSQQLITFLEDVTGCIARGCKSKNTLVTVNDRYSDFNHHHSLSADLCTQSTLSKWGYHLLVQCFPALKTLSLTNVGLTEETAEIFLKELTSLEKLNIADNDAIEGHCLRYLGPKVVSLTAGSFNLQVLILALLEGVVNSAAASGLRHLELTGCINGNLQSLLELPSLVSLHLHFYTDRIISAGHFAPFAPLASLSRLKTLVLQQEYCYEEESAVDGHLLAAIVRNCYQLNRLEVSGEYGWRLTFTDQNLYDIAEHGHALRHLLLTGNSSQITDTGVISLSRLRNLESLSLTSFDCITDTSICSLLPNLVNLNSLCLRDNAKLTIRTLDACVEVASTTPFRPLNVHMDEKQLSASQLLVKYATNYLRKTWQTQIDPLLDSCVSRNSQVEEEDQLSLQKNRRWPSNLNVVIDENLRSYKYNDEELTLVKLITIFLASAVIILMMITTLTVVVFLPVGMAIYLLYEKIFTVTNLQL